MTAKKDVPGTPRRFAHWSADELALIQKLSADGWSDEKIAFLQGRSSLSIAQKLGHAKYTHNACEGQNEQRRFEDAVREASARFAADAARILAPRYARRTA
jgi:hypothetical protein